MTIFECAVKVTTVTQIGLLMFYIRFQLCYNLAESQTGKSDREYGY